MKKWAFPLLAVALLFIGIGARPAQASGWHHGGHFRGHVFVGVGPAWWGPPWWYYPPPYYVYNPPTVVVEQPPVYIQQQPQAAPPPPPPPAPPAPPAAAESYWYYCPSAHSYYPNVQTCPEAWVKVPPRP